MAHLKSIQVNAESGEIVEVRPADSEGTVKLEIDCGGDSYLWVRLRPEAARAVGEALISCAVHADRRALRVELKRIRR